MRAFLIGLLALLMMCFLMVVGFLVYPILLAATLILRLGFGLVIMILFIWLLGQSIIFLWNKLEQKKCGDSETKGS